MRIYLYYPANRTISFIRYCYLIMIRRTAETCSSNEYR